ncbi:hypothetical protein IWX49DRAFT_216462 [Phyllosticta citricarpa]
MQRRLGSAMVAAASKQVDLLHNLRILSCLFSKHHLAVVFTCHHAKSGTSSSLFFFLSSPNRLVFLIGTFYITQWKWRPATRWNRAICHLQSARLCKRASNVVTAARSTAASQQASQHTKLLGFWICCCSSWRKKFWTVDFFFPPSHPSLLLPFDFLLFLSHIASFLFTHAGLGSGSVELGSLRTRAIYHHIHTHYATRARAPTPLRLHWVALLGWAAPARGLIILLISFELAAALHCAHVFLHRYHQPDSSFVAFDEDTDGSSYGVHHHTRN